MDQREFIAHVLTAFAAAGVAYMVGGAVASTHYGEARFTNDLDLVADLRPEQVEALRPFFLGDEWYFDDVMIREAIATRFQFNIIHVPTAQKVDVFLTEPSAYSGEEFARRWLRPLLPGVQAYLARPEDVVLMKLRYYAEGGSDRHLTDAAKVLQVSANLIDWAYVETWAARLGVANEWAALWQLVESTLPEA